MNYLKYTPYVYLIAGIFLMIDGIVTWSKTGIISWLNFIIAAMAFSMFFFRRKFVKKMENRNNKS